MLLWSMRLAVLGLLVILLIYFWVGMRGSKNILGENEDFPSTASVALVLGTSKQLVSGKVNWFFQHRVEAAAKLYHAGKVKKILVSGDNGTRGYNEPIDMRNALMALGVPEEDIILDYAGFRTLDSVVRANKVFGLSDFVVISQPFHVKRALFIARSKGISAYGFVCPNPNNSIKTRVREIPARVKAFLDCHILGVKPKFLGEEVPIQL